ncbi:patellin-4-like [Typha angustifolia]|uniref:patellin-4-like n=1 Tax=Typha angustifolia TaxID=59011 RepID=UPI003C2D53EE
MASSILDDLKPWERRALLEFRSRLEESILTNQLFRPQHHHEKSKARVANACYPEECDANEDDPKAVSLWGIPLLPSLGHEGTDVILFKFLQARDLRVSDALDMLQRALRWRREHRVDGILEEDVGFPELSNSTAYMDGVDKDGHPVCYNVYGVFKDKDLYRESFGNEEGRERFVRWRVQFMEKGIKELSFKPGGVGSMLQIIDLKDSLSHSMELRATTKKLVSILQDNYPEFVAKNIFLNVSFRSYAYHSLFSHFVSARSRSKFIFARPGKVTETLLKFIAPEDLPIQYGGFKRVDDNEFSPENGRVSEIVIKGGTVEKIVIPTVQPGVTMVWDVAVVGWDVSYKEEFVPDDEGSYRVLIREEKKLDEPLRNSFYISEPGKVVLTIENRSFKKKKILYRSKSKPTVPVYNLLNKTADRCHTQRSC